MKNTDKEIFIENTQPDGDDLRLFANASKDKSISQAEKFFFSQMEKKELGEFAPSADLLLSEHDNKDRLYLIRYNFDEYKIGKGLVNERNVEGIHADSLSELLDVDLFPFLGRHMSFLTWLRDNDFRGLNYNGNYALH